MQELFSLYSFLPALGRWIAGDQLDALIAMKKIWVPLFALLLLPASYSVQRRDERPETSQPPHEDSIRSQTEEPGETVLYFPDYVDGGGWSVQLALSNVDADTGAEVVPWKSTTGTVGRSWICSIRD